MPWALIKYFIIAKLQTAFKQNQVKINLIVPGRCSVCRYSLSTSLLYFMLFLQTMEGHSNAVICLVVANRLMYTGGADGSARCWVTEFGDCTRHYKGHKHSVICMKFDKGVCTYNIFCVIHYLLFLYFKKPVYHISYLQFPNTFL